VNDTPLVSVIIPLYNKKAYVKRAIKSVQNQSFTNWKLIVVNDGSTDGSPDEVPENDPKISLLHQENKGPGAARNLGIFMAKSKYVSFLDADDEWSPSFLDTCIAILQDSGRGATVACTGYYKYPEKIKSIEFLNISEINTLAPDVYEIDSDSDVKLLSDLWVFITSSSSIMRTDTAIKWGGYFDKFKCVIGEDRHFQLKLILNERIAVFPEPHSTYHTESSDLYGGGTISIDSNPDLVILDLQDLLNSCPENKKHLLHKILIRKAVASAMSFAIRGQRRNAKKVIKKIYPIHSADRKKVLIASLFAEAAPILPFLHFIWKK
jgi:glycosyltransferase involved in cell wall biosynthesis